MCRMFPSSFYCLATVISRESKFCLRISSHQLQRALGKEHSWTFSTRSSQWPNFVKCSQESGSSALWENSKFRLNLEKCDFSGVRSSGSEDLLECFLSTSSSYSFLVSFHHIMVPEQKPSSALSKVPNVRCVTDLLEIVLSSGGSQQYLSICIIQT